MPMNEPCEKIKNRLSDVSDEQKTEKKCSSAMAENSKIRKERPSAVAEDKKREEKVLPPWRKIKNVKETFVRYGGR